MHVPGEPGSWVGKLMRCGQGREQAADERLLPSTGDFSGSFLLLGKPIFLTFLGKPLLVKFPQLVRMRLKVLT